MYNMVMAKKTNGAQLALAERHIQGLRKDTNPDKFMLKILWHPKGSFIYKYFCLDYQCHFNMWARFTCLQEGGWGWGGVNRSSLDSN